MQLGFDKKRIKIRIKAIFIDNKVYELSHLNTTQFDSNSDPWQPLHNQQHLKLFTFQIMIYSHDYDIIAITETWLSSNMYIW